MNTLIFSHGTLIETHGFFMTPQIMTRKLSERDPVDDLVNTFRLFDTDGSGVLTFEKLKKISQGKFRIASCVSLIASTFAISSLMTLFPCFIPISELGECIGDDELREMIREADTDNDDAVTVQDFIRVMQRASKPQ